MISNEIPELVSMTLDQSIWLLAQHQRSGLPSPPGTHPNLFLIGRMMHQKDRQSAFDVATKLNLTDTEVMNIIDRIDRGEITLPPGYTRWAYLDSHDEWLTLDAYGTAMRGMMRADAWEEALERANE